MISSLEKQLRIHWQANNGAHMYEDIVEKLTEAEVIQLQECLKHRIIALVEMSHPRAKVEAKISDKADVVLKHIIKLLYWKDETNLKHHIHDIDNWLFEIQRLKPKSGTIKALDYYTWMFDEPVDSDSTIKYIINNELRKYHDLPQVGIDYHELFEILKDVYKMLADELESKQFTSISYITDIVLKRYN